MEKIGREKNWCAKKQPYTHTLCAKSRRQMGKNGVSNTNSHVRHTHQASKTNLCCEKLQKITFCLLPLLLSQPVSQSDEVDGKINRRTALAQQRNELRGLWHRNNKYQITAIQIWSEKRDARAHIFIRDRIRTQSHVLLCCAAMPTHSNLEVLKGDWFLLHTTDGSSSNTYTTILIWK